MSDPILERMAQEIAGLRRQVARIEQREAPRARIGGQLMMTIEGDLVVGTGALRFYNHLGRSITLSAVYAAAATAPTGAAILLDLHKAGTTIFTNQAHRPQIAAGANEGSTMTIDVAALADGEYLTLDVDQVGSTVAGSNLTVVVAYS